MWNVTTPSRSRRRKFVWCADREEGGTHRSRPPRCRGRTVAALRVISIGDDVSRSRLGESNEIDVVKELAGQIEDAELFLYPGSVHLFADPSLGDYDSAAAALLRQRTLSYLSRIN